MATVLATEQIRHLILAFNPPAPGFTPQLAGGFKEPSGIAVHADGRIAVTDTGNHRLAVLDPAAQAWSFLGGPGAGDGQFNHPRAVTWDSLGRVYVADSDNGRIVRVDDVGGGGWVSAGRAARPSAVDPGVLSFADPRGIAVDGAGRVLVADPGNRRLVRFSADAFDGHAPTEWTELALPAGGAPVVPFDVTAFAAGFAVTDVSNRAVHVFAANDGLLGTFDSANARLLIPAYVAALDEGLLAVGDPSANAVLVLRWQDGSLIEEHRISGSDPLLPRHPFDGLGGVAAGGA